jgi:hypothetical protein
MLWFTPLLPGIFILLGAIIGAGTTLLTSWTADRRKAAREDEQRWDVELLMRADNVVVATHALWDANANRQIAINKLLNSGLRDHVMEREAGKAHEAATRDFITARNKLAIIAPGAVVNASVALGIEYRKVIAKVELTPPPDSSPEPSSLGDFVDAVRVAAGIPIFTKRTKRKS